MSGATEKTPREEVIEALLWWHFVSEQYADDPNWPTHVPLGEADWENDWEDVRTAAIEARDAMEVEAFDPVDGCRLTSHGVEVATALFPDARAAFEASQRVRAPESGGGA